MRAGIKISCLCSATTTTETHTPEIPNRDLRFGHESDFSYLPCFAGRSRVKGRFHSIGWVGQVSVGDEFKDRMDGTSWICMDMMDGIVSNGFFHLK